MPVSYAELVQIYAYSMVVFCLAGLLDCVFLEYYRVQQTMLACASAASVWYSYKETLVVSKRFLSYSVYYRLGVGQCVQAALFALLMRFYFLA